MSRDQVSVAPSVSAHADAERDDATIRRCIGFSRRWGFGGIVVVNLFAYRATDPARLYDLSLEEAVGPENDAQVLAVCEQYETIIAAWGEHGTLFRRGDRVRAMLIVRGWSAQLSRQDASRQW